MQTNAFPDGSRAGRDSRKNRARVLGVMLCAPLGMFFDAACSNTGQSPQVGAGAQARYIVTAESTPFYKYGPAQPAGPDFQLKKDQLVTMVERHYGYSRVIDPDGETGYIPTEAIAPAPSQPRALASSTKTSPAKKSHGGSAPDFEQPNDIPLPAKQPPSDQPEPSFRY